jgi:hypothetical protein
MWLESLINVLAGRRIACPSKHAANVRVELKYQQTNRSTNTISLSFRLEQHLEFMKNAPHFTRADSRFKRGGHTPYGYAYLDGQLLLDPKEQIVVRKILKIHQSGLSENDIARELNNQKIPSGNSRSWCPSVVRGIIKNHLSNQNKNRRNK